MVFLVPFAISLLGLGTTNLDPSNELITDASNTQVVVTEQSSPQVVETALNTEPVETQITTFQAGHGFKKMNPSGMQLDDSENHVLGQQSLKLTTDGDGLAVFTRIIGISPPLDLD